jgi:hypothetical protein
MWCGCIVFKAFGLHGLFYVHNANMKSTVVSFLLLAALLCASNTESRATDADAADVAAVTPIDLDVDGNTQITLSSEEELLYNLIMEYRRENGLPPIPLSKSLTFVAQTHAKDLDTPGVVTGNCNGHSWSANGNWKSCCYTADHAKPHCIWDKPRELTCVSDNGLTCYRGNGFEIADGYYGHDGIMNAKTALKERLEGKSCTQCNHYKRWKLGRGAVEGHWCRNKPALCNSLVWS